jgi:toxin ParE1/3/4
MARIVITPLAGIDTRGILLDLAGLAGRATAAKYAGLFEQLFDRLEDHPASGAPRPALGPQIRFGIVPPYIVIYQHAEVDDTVTVLRVVHGRRRITGRLLTGMH